MAQRFKRVLPLNRVEGDLEIHLTIDEGGTVEDARSVGTMYRGFENLMKGRAPLDALVIPPRICGICTTAHLNAAAEALDMLYGAQVPDNARRLRNVTLMVEQMQNDIRHSFLLFMPDTTDSAYSKLALYPEAQRRYQPLKGETQLQTIAETQRLLEIIAILGGQWPHSSFMIPGGVVTVPSAADLSQCRHLLYKFRKWYETRILGCDLDTWREVQSVAQLNEWLHMTPGHAQSDVGLLLRFGRAAGFDRLGRGHGRFITYGGPRLPQESAVEGFGDTERLFPTGIFERGTRQPLDPRRIAEDVACAYYEDQGSAHPYEAVTVPRAEAGGESEQSQKYSWAKAPRYAGHPAETGPLADLLAAGHPLITDWVAAHGPSVLVRQLARLIRPAALLPAADTWLREMTTCTSPYYRQYLKRTSGKGFGTITAPRGALGHWIRMREGVISNYQVITPTAWNGSPRDAKGIRGPWEEALVGTALADPVHPIEVEHVVRSFDPCLVCTVHVVDTRNHDARRRNENGKS
ncbi:MAG: nickel-dependent hydrogenase large subunit [Desulfosarcinaceae bacterium]